MNRWAGRLQEAIGLEHVVLEHEVSRVGPVVRDLAARCGSPSRCPRVAAALQGQGSALHAA